MKRGKWRINRKQPYTKTGIKRLRCIRCGDRAAEQWQVCADGNNYRPLCLKCGDTLNAMVLAWMGHPDVDTAMGEYWRSR